MKSKKKDFEQYLYRHVDIEHEDEVQRYIDASMPLIGFIVMNFNGLEKELDSTICEIFTDRTDATGLIVLHKVNYATKVELFKRFNDDLLSCVEWKLKNYDALIKNLRECGRLRNLVVHADWENTDKDNYTYVNLRISKEGIEQKYIQFSEDSLAKINELISNTRRDLENFWENRNEKLYSQH